MLRCTSSHMNSLAKQKVIYIKPAKEKGHVDVDGISLPKAHNLFVHADIYLLRMVIYFF